MAGAKSSRWNRPVAGLYAARASEENPDVVRRIIPPASFNYVKAQVQKEFQMKKFLVIASVAALLFAAAPLASLAANGKGGPGRGNGQGNGQMERRRDGSGQGQQRRDRKRDGSCGRECPGYGNGQCDGTQQRKRDGSCVR